jgi:predicted Zn-dependent protease
MKTGKGPATEQQAIAQLGSGIYLPGFSYTGMEDAKTGTFSGFTRYGMCIVEDGKIVARAPNMLITESLHHLLRDVEWLSSRSKQAFTSGSYGVEIIPGIRVPCFAQVRGFNVVLSDNERPTQQSLF